MGENWFKKLLCFSAFSVLGLTILIPRTVFAIPKYTPVKNPREVLPLFINEVPIYHNVYGKYYLNNIKSIDLSNSCIDDNLEDIISLFNNLSYINLRNHSLSYEQIHNIKERYPHIKLDYDVNIDNKIYDSNIEELDLSYIKINDLEDFKNRLSLLPKLKKLDMSYSNLSNEQLGELREIFPNVQIDWVLYLSKWRFRTDVKSFSVLVYKFDYVKIKSSDLEVFKYCWNLEYLDLGHQAITDISLIPKYLLNLKLLILADNKISDITPLKELKHLHYLELFINPIHDISALSNLKELVDLNLCYDRIRDFSPIYDLPMLERIWLVGTGINYNSVNELKKYHPNAQIVYTGGGSTNSGYRTHKRYYEMLKMFKDRYYVSTEFTKFDNAIEEHNYLNEMVDIIVDHKLGSKDNKLIYLTNYGYLKDNKNVRVHILGEYTGISKYHGQVIAIIRRKDEDILVVSNTSYSSDAINALIEYKEKNSKYELIK